MLRAVLLFSVVCLFMSSPLSATVPSGLELSGSGEIRYLGIFKVYEASLWAPKDSSADDILRPNRSRCLQLDYAVELSVETFIEAADAILARQHDQQTLASVRKELDTLNNIYRDVNEDDRYQLCYDADTETTHLILNGRELGAVTSARFAEVYFGIWLGKTNPIDAELRESLLAGLQKEQD